MFNENPNTTAVRLQGLQEFKARIATRAFMVLKPNKVNLNMSRVRPQG